MEDKMAVNAGEPFLLQFTIANKTDYSILIDNAQLFLVRVIGMSVWLSALLVWLKSFSKERVALPSTFYSRLGRISIANKYPNFARAKLKTKDLRQ